VLALHGTGGDERDLVPLAQDVAPGAAILSPRGRVLEHGMPRFFRRLAVGVFDLDDLRQRTAELADFVQAAADRYGFEPARLVALGYSNGANIGASLLLLRPEALGDAALLRPTLPFEPEPLLELFGRRIFLASGDRDPYAPPDRVRRLAELLSAAGAEVEHHWSAGSHGLEPEDFDEARRWFAALPA
jgi:predicted esterase